MREFILGENPVDRPDRRQLLYAKFFHLPENCLSTAEQILIVKTEANHFDDFLDLRWCVIWSRKRTTRTILTPRGIVFVIPPDPLVQPELRLAERCAD